MISHDLQVNRRKLHFCENSFQSLVDSNVSFSFLLFLFVIFSVLLEFQ